MKHRIYIVLFLVLSLLFCPIIMFLGLGAASVSVFQMGIFMANQLLAHINALDVYDLYLAMWLLVHFAVYAFIFYSIAKATFRLSMHLKSQKNQLLLQTAILFTLILPSLFPVFGFTSIADESSPTLYNLWELLCRQFQQLEVTFNCKFL